ncbi:MAG: decaprenyl-phosphate phosphoribosyltransferase [Deltaproteobacteria bacterium]|nr:decaprenyl-phosphate phosphoribosyltransferase [Deltaproteobacteria bacterium]
MLRSSLQLLRPLHWIKNLFVLAPLLFAQHLFDSNELGLALVAFCVFCLLSSAVYAFNDVQDAERDRAHPHKSLRPVASGRIRPAAALVASACLAVAALGLAFALRWSFGAVGLVYLGLNLVYSRWLKRIAFVDVLLIAAGFVLRVVGGALVIEVEISIWLVPCTFFLACLLGFGKRRHELETQPDDNTTRPALAGYSARSLRIAEVLAALMSLLCYLAYSLAPGTVAKFGTHWLVATLPFPALGVWRYLHLVESKRDLPPTEALVGDAPSWLNLIAWVVAVTWILYA